MPAVNGGIFYLQESDSFDAIVDGFINSFMSEETVNNIALLKIGE